MDDSQKLPKPPKTSPHFSKAIYIILILAAIGGFILYVIYTNGILDEIDNNPLNYFHKKKPTPSPSVSVTPTPSPSITITPSPTPTPNPDMQTYVNTKYKITFSYPKTVNLTLDDSSDSSIPGATVLSITLTDPSQSKNNSITVDITNNQPDGNYTRLPNEIDQKEIKINNQAVIIHYLPDATVYVFHGDNYRYAFWLSSKTTGILKTSFQAILNSVTIDSNTSI